MRSARSETISDDQNPKRQAVLNLQFDNWNSSGIQSLEFRIYSGAILGFWF